MKTNGLRAQNQPTFIYDIEKPWEEVVQNPPVWVSNKFPPLPKLYSFLGQNIISPIVIAAGPASGKIWTDFYFKMDEDARQEFKVTGEQTAAKIEQLLGRSRVRARAIFKLIIAWLKIIPGVNKLFINQEAKIKTDKIMRLTSKPPQ